MTGSSPAAREAAAAALYDVTRASRRDHLDSDTGGVSGHLPVELFDKVMPESWADLDEARRNHCRRLAAAAVDAFAFHVALHGAGA